MLRTVVFSSLVLSLSLLVPVGSAEAVPGKRATKPAVLKVRAGNLNEATPTKSVKSLVKALRGVRGVRKAKINKKAGMIIVHYRRPASEREIQAVITGAGFSLIAAGSAKQPAPAPAPPPPASDEEPTADEGATVDG